MFWTIILHFNTFLCLKVSLITLIRFYLLKTNLHSGIFCQAYAVLLFIIGVKIQFLISRALVKAPSAHFFSIKTFIHDGYSDDSVYGKECEYYYGFIIGLPGDLCVLICL
jgi:hypothetical protein